MKKKILIIDDEKDFTQLVKSNLEQTDKYIVETENNPLVALVTASQFKPDLIFLDIMMPDLSGDVLAKELKQEPGLGQVPIIFLTATTTKEEVDSADGVIGGFSFIAKPADTAQLIEYIEKHLGG